MSFAIDDENRAKLRQILHPIEQNTSWIGEVFKTYLRPIQPDATVCAIGVGQTCEELLHLRNFTGPQARIFAVDVKSPKDIGILITAYTDSQFLLDDLRAPVGIAQQMGSMPDLVIMRHPRIVKQLIGPGKVLKYNEWWLPALASWAMWILHKQGQMLITFMAKEEQDLMATYLRQQQIRYRKSSNNFAPKVIQANYGRQIARPDSFIIKIPN